MKCSFLGKYTDVLVTKVHGYHCTCSALNSEDSVLWVDSDIISAPSDMLPAMIASNLDIITPNSYFVGKSFWKQKPKYFDFNVFQGQQLL